MNSIAIPFHRFLQAAWNLVCAFASTVLVRLQTTTITVLTATLLLVVGRDLGKSTTAGNRNSNQQQSDPPSSLYRLAYATGVASLMVSPSSCRRGSVETRLNSPPDKNRVPLQPEAALALALQEEPCVPKPDETTATTTMSASNGEDCGSNTDTGATAGANPKGDDKNALDSKGTAPPPPTVIHLPLRAERRISRVARLSARLRKRCNTSESPGSPGTTTIAGAKRSWEDHSDLTDTDDNEHQKVDTTGREDPFTNHPSCLRIPKKTRWALRFVARNRERSRADRSRRRTGILASSLDSYGKEQKFRKVVLWAHTVEVGAVVIPSDDLSVSTNNSTTKNVEDSIPSRTDQ